MVDVEEARNFYINNNLAYTEDNVVVHKVFAYSIPKQITNRHVLQYFSRFGEVVKVYLKSCPIHYYGAPRKVGFIEFVDAVAAAKVLQTSKHTIRRKSVFVKACDSWHQPTAYDDDEGEADSFSEFIGKIDDDTLYLICERLSLKDQVSFSRTCTRFGGIFDLCAKRLHKRLVVDQLNDMSLWEAREFFQKTGHIIESFVGQLPTRNRTRIAKFMNSFCTKLQKVSLAMTIMETSIVRKLFRNMTDIRELRLSACALLDSSILILADQLPNLEALALADNFLITGKYISRFVQVSELNLRACSGVVDAYIEEICQSLTSLKSLDIRHSPFASTGFFGRGSRYCGKLEELKISGPVVAQSQMRYDMVASLPKLKSFEIVATAPRSYLLEEAFFVALEQTKKLEKLKIVSTSLITWQRADRISNLEHLKVLVWSNNDSLNDDCLKQFRVLSNLEEIVCKDCRNITNKGVLGLLRSCGKLKLVNLQRCPNIEDELVYAAIDILRATRKNPRYPVIFYVTNSGISQANLTNEVYLSAKSHIKLCFDVSSPWTANVAEAYDHYDDNEHDNRDYLDDDEYGHIQNFFGIIDDDVISTDESISDDESEDHDLDDFGQYEPLIEAIDDENIL